MNFEHFDIYWDGKHIFAYNLSCKRCHVDSYESEPSSKPENNTFQFYNEEKHIKNFLGIDSKLFNIYKNEKHILAFSFLLF